MKIIFAGTPDVAVPTLQALIASDHEVVAVYTQPDRKAGRGRKLQPSPVKQCALQASIPVEQPESLKDAAVIEHLANYNADLMVVVAYGLLLPDAVLTLPKRGCVNVHFSLLPRWRGAAPIQYAILNGDKKTGVSIIQITNELDAGDVLAIKDTPINGCDNNQTLSTRLAQLGAELLVKTLSSEWLPKSQDLMQVTYAKKIQKSDAKINWGETAEVIERKIRAYYGWPVAFTLLDDEPLRIWQATAIPAKFSDTPGTFSVVDKEVIVVCGENALVLSEVQLPGKKIMSGEAFAHFYEQKNRVNHSG